MGEKVFLRQKWTRYLGELRPIHDIDVFFIPSTPSPTPSFTPTLTPTKTVTPTVTPTITTTISPSVTPTLTPTTSCSPFTTQYMKSELQGNNQIKFSVFTDAGYTINTTAVCDYVISGTYDIQNGSTNVPYSTTMVTGNHTHNYNTGNQITGFTITSVIPACVCVNIIANIVSPTPTNTATQTATPTLTSTLTPTPSVTPTLTPTLTVTPSNTPICNNMVFGFDYVPPASGGNMLGYSVNGISVSGASPNPSVFIVGNNPSGITSIATNGSRWVAVGSNGAVNPNSISLGLYSNNGISWSLSDLATVRTTVNNPIEDVIWDGTRFLGVGASGTPLVQSNNGISWSAITGSNISLTSSTPAIREAFIYFDNTSYWVGGSSFYKSNNGNVYTAQTMSGINRYNDMLYTQSKWILAGRLSTTSTGVIQVSNDGLNWTGQTIPSCSDVYCLTTNGNIILAGCEGTNKLLYSYDGLTWSAQSVTGIFTTSIRDFSYNGSVFVGGGVGTNTVGYSYDGLNWTASTLSQTVNRCEAIASIPDLIVYPNISENCPTSTPTPTRTATPTLTPSITQTLTPSITQTLTPTPSSTSGVTGCLCYRLLNETGNQIQYQWDDCVLGASNGTLNGGQSVQVCAVDLPVIDPGGTITACTTVTNCGQSSDCTGCN